MKSVYLQFGCFTALLRQGSESQLTCDACRSLRNSTPMVSMDSSDRALHGVLGLHLSPHTLLCLLLGAPWGRTVCRGQSPHNACGSTTAKSQIYGVEISATHLVFHEANRYDRNRGESCTVMQKAGFRNMQERYIESFKLFISVSTLDCPSKMHRHVWWKETSNLNRNTQITNLRSKFSYNFADNSYSNSWSRKITAEWNKIKKE